MGAMNPFLVQDHFRIRDDNTAADPGTPNWITTEDQGTAEVINTATMFRIRFVISNTGAANATSNFDLYVSKNGGSYAAVTTTSSNVQAVDGGDASSADATVLSTGNFQLTAGTGTAAAGEYDEDGSVGANLSNGDYFEVEYCVSIVYADVADADTLDFRVYYNGAAMDSYSVTPRVEVNKTVAFLTQAYTRIRSDANSPDGGTPTWETTENQTAALSWNTNTDFRIRVVLENTGGVEEANQFNLYVSKNAGAYALITTTSNNVQAKDVVGGGSIRFETSNYLLTAGAGHPLPGWYSAVNQLNRDIAGNEYVEYDIGLTIVDADVANNDTLDFRLYYNGSALDQYDHTPRITVSKASDTNVLANAEAIALNAQTATIANDVNVNANVEATTLTAQAASIDYGVNVLANAEAVTLTAQLATITYDVNVNANAEATTLTANQASIDYDVNVLANAESVTLTSQAATVAFGVNVAAGFEALTLSSQLASISNDVNVNASAETTTLTSNQASILYGVNVDAGPEAITLTSQPATITYNVDVQAAAEAVALTAQVASIDYAVNVLANAEAIALTSQTASISTTSDVNINASAETLQIAAHMATIDGGGGSSSGKYPLRRRRRI